MSLALHTHTILETADKMRHKPKQVPPASPPTPPLDLTLILDPTTAVNIHAAIIDRIDKLTLFIVKEPVNSSLLPFYRDERERLQRVDAQLNASLWGQH